MHKKHSGGDDDASDVGSDDDGGAVELDDDTIVEFYDHIGSVDDHGDGDVGRDDNLLFDDGGWSR